MSVRVRFPLTAYGAGNASRGCDDIRIAAIVATRPRRIRGETGAAAHRGHGMSEAEEDPYRRAPPAAAARGALQLGDEPLRFSTNRSERNSGPVGRGGWLIAVAVMLAWSLLYGIVNLAGLALMLASPELDANKHAALQFFVLVSGAMFVFNLAVLALYGMKSPWFPRAYVAWLGVALVAMAVAYGLLAQATGGGFLGVAIAAAIARALFWNGPWIAYAIMSDRVKNTFVARRG